MEASDRGGQVSFDDLILVTEQDERAVGSTRVSRQSSRNESKPRERRRPPALRGSRFNMSPTSPSGHRQRRTTSGRGSASSESWNTRRLNRGVRPTPERSAPYLSPDTESSAAEEGVPTVAQVSPSSNRNSGNSRYSERERQQTPCGMTPPLGECRRVPSKTLNMPIAPLWGRQRSLLDAGVNPNATFLLTRNSTKPEFGPEEFSALFHGDEEQPKARACVDAEHPCMVAWRWFMVIFLFSDMWLIPMQLVVFEDPMTWWRMYGWATSLLYLVEIPVSLSSAAFRCRARGAAARSLRLPFWCHDIDWLLICDLVAAVAFPVAIGTAYDSLVMLRLVRAFKASHQRATPHLRWGTQFRSLSKMLSIAHMMLLCCHWVSIGWLALGLVEHQCESENGCWTMRSDNEDRWSLYTESLEWSSRFVKPPAGNNLERAYTMGTTIGSAVAVGSVLAMLQKSVLDFDRRRGQAQKTVAEVLSFLQRRGATMSLQTRVASYIEAAYDRQDIDGVQAVRDISVTLSRDVCAAIYGPKISRFPFFMELGNGFVDALCEKIFERNCVPDEVIVSQGHIINEFICLTEGSMYGYSTVIKLQGTEPFSDDICSRLPKAVSDDNCSRSSNRRWSSNLLAKARFRHAAGERGEFSSPIGRHLTEVTAKPKYTAFTWVGEMSLFSSNDVIPRWDATYQASEFSLLLCVNRGSFDEVIAGNPEWLQKVLERRVALASEEIFPEAFGCRRCANLSHAEEHCHLARSRSQTEGFWRLVNDNSSTSHHTSEMGGDSENESPTHNPRPSEEAQRDVKNFVCGLLEGTMDTDDITRQFGQIYPEMSLFDPRDPEQKSLHDRCLHTVLSTFWILQNKYEEFTSSQQAEQKLSEPSWQEMLAMATAARLSVEDWHALDHMIIAQLLRYVAKLKSWRRLYAPGISDPSVALSVALSNHADLCHSFERLPHLGKADVRALLDLDAEFNLAQLLQAESLPDSLSAFKTFVEQYGRIAQRRYEFKWVCGMCSLTVHSMAGSECMTENMYRSISLVLRSLENVAQMSAMEAYHRYLRMRAEVQALPFQTAFDRSVVRVACFLRSYDNPSALEAQAAFESMPCQDKDMLVEYLAGTPTRQRPAIMLVYAPDILLAVKRNPGLSLQSGLKALRQAFNLAAAEFQRSAHGHVAVMCNELKKMAGVANNDNFFLSCVRQMQLHRSPGNQKREAVLFFRRQIWEELDSAEPTQAAASTSTNFVRHKETDFSARLSGGSSSNRDVGPSVRDLVARVDNLESNLHQRSVQLGGKLQQLQSKQRQQDKILRQILHNQKEIMAQLQGQTLKERFKEDDAADTEGDEEEEKEGEVENQPLASEGQGATGETECGT